MSYLTAHGASFFQELHDGVGGGYPGETLDALWALVWQGLADERCAWLRCGLTAINATSSRSTKADAESASANRVSESRRTTPPTAQGRWA